MIGDPNIICCLNKFLKLAVCVIFIFSFSAGTSISDDGMKATETKPSRGEIKIRIMSLKEAIYFTANGSGETPIRERSLPYDPRQPLTDSGFPSPPCQVQSGRGLDGETIDIGPLPDKDARITKISYSGDRRYVALPVGKGYDARFAYNLLVIDTQTRAVVMRKHFHGFISDVAWSPDNKFIALLITSRIVGPLELFPALAGHPIEHRSFNLRIIGLDGSPEVDRSIVRYIKEGCGDLVWSKAEAEATNGNP